MLNAKLTKLFFFFTSCAVLVSCGGSQSDGFLRFLSFDVQPLVVDAPSPGAQKTVSLQYAVESVPTAHAVSWWVIPIGTSDEKIPETTAIYAVDCPNATCVNKAVINASCKVTLASDDANARILDCGIAAIPPQRLNKGKYQWQARAANYRANFGIVPDTDKRNGEIEFR